ncbi:hypothetical protein WUBG_13370, partial [Wuchereria bancrofti]
LCVIDHSSINHNHQHLKPVEDGKASISDNGVMTDTLSVVPADSSNSRRSSETR